MWGHATSLVVGYRSFGTNYRSFLQGPSSQNLLYPWPISRPETSVTNYQYTLGNIPEEQRSHSHRGRRLKSRKFKVVESCIILNCVQEVAPTYFLKIYSLIVSSHMLKYLKEIRCRKYSQNLLFSGSVSWFKWSLFSLLCSAGNCLNFPLTFWPIPGANQPPV